MKNILKNLPDASKKEIFETLLQEKEMKLERITSQAQVTPEGEWLSSDKNEWVLVLKGAAKLSFQRGDSLELSEGDYLLIPANTHHRVEWTAENEPTVWLALHY